MGAVIRRITVKQVKCPHQVQMGCEHMFLNSCTRTKSSVESAIKQKYTPVKNITHKYTQWDQSNIFSAVTINTNSRQCEKILTVFEKCESSTITSCFRQDKCTASQHKETSVIWFIGAEYTWGVLVTAMIGQRGRYLDSRCADLERCGEKKGKCWEGGKYIITVGTHEHKHFTYCITLNIHY